MYLASMVQLIMMDGVIVKSFDRTTYGFPRCSKQMSAQKHDQTHVERT